MLVKIINFSIAVAALLTCTLTVSIAAQIDAMSVEAGQVKNLSYWIYADGEGHDRHVFYARHRVSSGPPVNLTIQAISKGPSAVKKLEATFKSAEVVEVLESSNGPGTTTYDVDLQCDTRQINVGFVYSIWRDDHVEQSTGQGWSPVEAGWQSQVLKFACDIGASNSQQFERIGDYLPAQLDDLTWKKYWRDGEQVPYTTQKTMEQLNARQGSNDEALQQLSQSTDAKLHGALQQQEIDIQQSGERSRKLIVDASRRRYPVLESWINATEDQVIHAWGQPDRFSENSGSRFLRYIRGYDNQHAIMQSGAGWTGVVGYSHESHECTIVFEIRQGSVLTYSTVDMDRCYDTRLPRGPN